MENSIKLQANVQNLRLETEAFRRIRDGMDKEGDQHIHTWLENVKFSDQHLHEIEKELDEIQRGLLPNSMSVRLKLNDKVIEYVKIVKNLKQRAVELFLRGVAGDKLKRFSSEDIISFTSDLSKQIGSGGYARVYRGQFPDNVQIAVKVLEQNHVMEEIFMTEVDTLLKATHSNLINLYGFCFDDEMKTLLYEFMENGSLEDVLLQKPCLVEWQTLYAMTIEIARGLAYLHHECDDRIIHHDIKPSNILLDTKFSPRVSDFGTARIINSDISHFTMTSMRGTRGYTAPEMFMQASKVTYKCDVYSFGKMLLDVLGIKRDCHEKVWKKLEKRGLDESIKECGIMAKDTKRARILLLVAYWCIQFSADIRPSMKDVVNALEEKIHVRKSPNPFLSWEGSYSMQQSEDVIYPTEISPFTDESLHEDEYQGDSHSASESQQKENAGKLFSIVHPQVMEDPSGLEDNWGILSKEMFGLKYFRSEVAFKKAQQMASWLEKVKCIAIEFDRLKIEFKESKDGSLSERVTLNKKVIDILKSVGFLKEEGNVASDSVETLFSGLGGENGRRFSLADLRSFTSNFSTTIDSRRGGDVYKGRFPSGMQVVVKIVTERMVIKRIFMAEISKMLITSHRNLVHLYGFCFEENMKALVFEYMPNGSLDKILFDTDRHHGNIRWDQLYNIATGIAKGLMYLHEGCDKQLIHGDLKASNVLLDSDFSPKVTNYGVGSDKNPTLDKLREDPSYLPPEMMQTLNMTHKGDVYSFGMLMLEVLGRRRNIKGRVYFPRLIYDKLAKGDVEGIIKECGLEEKNREKAMILCMVAFWCIQYTLETRPSMSIVVKMLEKELKVMKPPCPFSPSKAYSVKPIVDVVYDPSDFGCLSL